MRCIYVSKPGGKPMDIGINRAKRRAHRLDKRDQLEVLKRLGPGLPREHSNHYGLVQARHHYYHYQHDELARSQSDGGVAK